MTPLSIDQVETIHGHTHRIRGFAALLRSVLQAEHVIGREAHALAIDAVLKQNG